MRWMRLVLPAILALTVPGRGQEATDDPQASQKQPEPKTWSLSASVYAYFVPNDRDYVQPTFAADRGHLHLEARYNYEAYKTGSLWAGYNLSAGNKLTFDFTPMLGAVFGDTNGVAPGYEMTLSWRILEFYSESEYVLVPADHSENFGYTWSQLTLAPVGWFQFGLVAQRTRAYQTDLDVQRGLLLGFSWKRVDLGAYLFNPDREQPTLVLSVTVNF